MPCLRLRALASFTSKETISASMSERTVAMAAWRALPIGKRSFARGLVLSRMLSRLSAYGPS